MSFKAMILSQIIVKFLQTVRLYYQINRRIYDSSRQMQGAQDDR